MLYDTMKTKARIYNTLVRSAKWTFT